MRSFPSLGCVNAALVSLYFVPVWGGDALRALTSPYNGFEDRVQATAARPGPRPGRRGPLQRSRQPPERLPPGGG